MSDEGFRELERRWRETGACEAAAALLRARWRAGQADEARMLFAAQLGYPPCRALFPEVGECPSPWELTRLAAECDQHDWAREAKVRLTLALAGTAVRLCPEKLPFRALCEGALGVAEEGLLLQDSARSAGMSDVAHSVIDQRDSLLEYGPAYKATTLVSFAAEFVAKLADPKEELLFDRALLMTLRCGIEDGAFMEGLASEVAPWLVGLADPVRERVEGRQQGAAG